ncbi:MAG: YifB family Mg chelatase-like AAA ATPase [Ferrimonas sp.]
MALAHIYSRGQLGIKAPAVTVETHLGSGLPSFTLVGLPEASVREAKERVRAALQTSGFSLPVSRITINLAPADLPKQGGRFDLPIALGILCASGQLPAQALDNCEFYGELGLSGEIRSVSGLLPALVAGNQKGKRLFIPQANAAEATLLPNGEIHLVHTLTELITALLGQGTLTPVTAAPWSAPTATITQDLQQIIGQDHGKRALLIAAAGGHNLLFLGPPGTGKTMLASRLGHLLPPLTMEQGLAVAAIHSVAGLSRDPTQLRQRPFRAPHHSSSAASLVGGGSIPQPGEISLAHHGVLFLDELPEYSRVVLDNLRQPLEAGEVVISRAAAKLCFPAKFQLIAAMNPSPSGDIGHGSRDTPEQIRRYLGRLSGPLLDRFDLSVAINRLPSGSLSQAKASGPTTAQAQSQVAQAQQYALQRQGKLNHQLAGHELNDEVGLSQPLLMFTEQAIDKLKLSVRAYHRILKVARTIADLDQQTIVSRTHVSEALGYRAMDRLLQELRHQIQ